MIRDIQYSPDAEAAVMAAHKAIARSQATIRARAAKINKYKHAIENIGRARFSAAHYRPIPESVRREQYLAKLVHYQQLHAAAVAADANAHTDLERALAAQQRINIADLPDEMLLHILQYVGADAGARLTCHHLHACIAVKHMRYSADYGEYDDFSDFDEYLANLHRPNGFVSFARLHRPHSIRIYGYAVPAELASVLNSFADFDPEILLHTDAPPNVYGLAVARLNIRNAKVLKKIQLSKLQVLTLSSPRQICSIKYSYAFLAEIRFENIRRNSDELPVHFHHTVQAELRISRGTHAALLAAGWELALPCVLD